MTMAKRRQLARELDTRVRYLRLTGMNHTALVAAMSDWMADFQALMDKVIRCNPGNRPCVWVTRQPERSRARGTTTIG